MSWGPPQDITLTTVSWKCIPESPYQGPEGLLSEGSGSTITKLFTPELAFSVSLPGTHPSHTGLPEHVPKCKCDHVIPLLKTLPWIPAALQKKSKHLSKTLPPWTSWTPLVSNNNGKNTAGVPNG